MMKLSFNISDERVVQNLSEKAPRISAAARRGWDAVSRAAEDRIAAGVRAEGRC
jgi:hypothetical protein